MLTNRNHMRPLPVHNEIYDPVQFALEHKGNTIEFIEFAFHSLAWGPLCGDFNFYDIIICDERCFGVNHRTRSTSSEIRRRLLKYIERTMTQIATLFASSNRYDMIHGIVFVFIDCHGHQHVNIFMFEGYTCIFIVPLKNETPTGMIFKKQVAKVLHMCLERSTKRQYHWDTGNPMLYSNPKHTLETYNRDQSVMWCAWACIQWTRYIGNTELARRLATRRSRLLELDWGMETTQEGMAHIATIIFKHSLAESYKIK